MSRKKPPNYFGLLDVVQLFEDDLLTFDPGVTTSVYLDDSVSGLIALQRGDVSSSGEVTVGSAWVEAIELVAELVFNSDVFTHEESWPVCPIESETHLLVLKRIADDMFWVCSMTDEPFARVGCLTARLKTSTSLRRVNKS